MPLATAAVAATAVAAPIATTVSAAAISAPTRRYTMEEEALIISVLRLRLNGESVAQVAALLEQEGTSVPLSQVKKACSKAAKRAPAAPAAAPAAAPPAPDGASNEKKEAKKAKAAAAMIKSAESAMLESQRRLKLAKDSDEINAQVPRHAMEGFIQRQTKLAVGGILGPGDAAVLRVSRTPSARDHLREHRTQPVITCARLAPNALRPPPSAHRPPPAARRPPPTAHRPPSPTAPTPPPTTRVCDR